MDEKDWWYLNSERLTNGPISETNIRELLDAGTITFETLVWIEGMAEWIALSKTELAAPPKQRSSDSGGDAPFELNEEKKEAFDDVAVLALPQTHPWLRFWARYLDNVLAVFIGVLLFGKIFPELSILLWVPIETVLLSTWGYTPGKWLCNIQVRTSDGSNPSIETALQRASMVWLIGEGAWYQFFPLITMIVAFVILTRTGNTFWDRVSNVQVHHGEIGSTRKMILWVIGIFFAWSFIYGIVLLLQKQ